MSVCKLPFRIARIFPDCKVHGANMEPIWGRRDPGGPHVGPMNFAIWVSILYILQRYPALFSYYCRASYTTQSLTNITKRIDIPMRCFEIHGNIVEVDRKNVCLPLLGLGHWWVFIIIYNRSAMLLNPFYLPCIYLMVIMKTSVDIY